MPAALPEPTLDQLVCFEIYAANLAMHRLYKPLLDPLGLTYPQFLVLKALWEEDGRSLGAIGSALGLESSTLTPLVKRLEARGLVARARDGADERRVRVSLTEAGRAMEGQTAGFGQCIVEGTGLDIGELTTLHALLGKLLGKAA
ncbi:MarR family winged helix-turn-helix transcriptional regulator [Pseudoroseicyclus sp. CXY001]|uniref:MarR family winged helix-turn-helix transcriptional regulator n=1 Tax=Pseudoroseicyclus sp. CXY001 TaxID=3242492 RepID=UPI003570FC9B